MSINREMDEEDVVHIYNGILLSHKEMEKQVIYKGIRVRIALDFSTTMEIGS